MIRTRLKSIRVKRRLSSGGPSPSLSRALLAMLFMIGSTSVSSRAFAGYDAHITRKEQWSADSGPRISFVEWLEYVRTDPQVKRDPQNTKNDFSVSLADEVFPLWFDPDLGELRTKDPSDKTLLKLIQIAKKLHARVQRDDGEFYPLKP